MASSRKTDRAQIKFDQTDLRKNVGQTQCYTSTLKTILLRCRYMNIYFIRTTIVSTSSYKVQKNSSCFELSCPPLTMQSRKKYNHANTHVTYVRQTLHPDKNDTQV